MADRRYYAKMDVGYLDNPKVAPLIESHPRAILLHMWAIAYSRQHGTDGVVNIRQGMRHAYIEQCSEHCGEQCNPQCDLEVLMQSGLLDPIDRTTRMVHDYLEHQESSESLKAASDKGKRAAEARWRGVQGDAPSNASSNASSNAVGNASSNAKERRGEESTSAAFADFWDTYPKKTAKGAAERSWAKAAKSADPILIVAAAASYARQRSGEDPKFTKHPATWLNQRCWEDVPTEAKPRHGEPVTILRDGVLTEKYW